MLQYIHTLYIQKIEIDITIKIKIKIKPHITNQKIKIPPKITTKTYITNKIRVKTVNTVLIFII